MAKKKKSPSPKAKISSTTQKLIDTLKKIESAGDGGLPIYAPKTLQDKMSAIVYNGKGVAPANGGLVKTLGEYIQKTKTETLSISQEKDKKGKDKKPKQFQIEYFSLSTTGKAWLAYQRDLLLESKREELRKKAESLEGIRGEMENQKAELKQISQKIEKLPEVLGKLQDQSSSKISDLGKSFYSAIEGLQSQFKDFFRQLDSLKDQFDGQVKELATSISHQTASALRQELAPLQDQLNQLESTHKIWRETLLQSPALSNGGDSKGKVSDLAQIEEELTAHLLKLIPKERPISIEKLYHQITQQGFSLRPGHCNDLLWNLYQQKKIRLVTWPWTIGEIKNREHAIFRYEVIYAEVQKL